MYTGLMFPNLILEATEDIYYYKKKQFSHVLEFR